MTATTVSPALTHSIRVIPCTNAERTDSSSAGLAVVAVVLALLFLPWRATAAPEPPASAGPPLDARESAHDRVA